MAETKVRLACGAADSVGLCQFGDELPVRRPRLRAGLGPHRTSGPGAPGVHPSPVVGPSPDGWQRARLARIDADLAEARELWAWYADPGHRQQVAHAFAWWRRPYVLLLVPLGYASLWQVRYGLYRLGDGLAGRVIELAGRPVWSTGRALLDRLREARSAYTGAEGVWSLAVRHARAAGRRLAEVQDRFWDLLVGTRWWDLGPAEEPVNDDTLTRDWTRREMMRRRRVLLQPAMGMDRLVLDGSPGTEPRIEVVTGGPDLSPSAG